MTCSICGWLSSTVGFGPVTSPSASSRTRPDGWTTERAIENLEAKLADERFTTDLTLLIAAQPPSYSVQAATGGCPPGHPASSRRVEGSHRPAVVQTRDVLVVRGSKKLRDRVKAPLAEIADESTTVLSDWFATALLLEAAGRIAGESAHVRTGVHAARSGRVAARPSANRDRRSAAAPRRRRVVHPGPAQRDTRAADHSDDDRSVVGVMNEFAFHGEIRWDEA